MSKPLKILDIQYESDSDIQNAHLILRGRITLVRGNSGVGKTYLVELLYKTKSALHDNIASVKINVDINSLFMVTTGNGLSIEMKDFREITYDVIKKFSNKIIIIDEADQLLEGFDALRKFIEHDTNNIYVLICRDSNLLNLGVTPANIATAVINNGVLELDYKYDVGGW